MPIAIANISPERYALLLERAKLEGSVTVTSEGARIVIDDVRLEAWYTDGTIYVSIYKAPFYVEPAEVEKLLARWLVVPEAPGSGSERWPNAGWTEAGDGTGYPGDVPTQEQAEEVKSGAQKERDDRAAESGE
jgi:hypothetical protein